MGRAEAALPRALRPWLPGPFSSVGLFNLWDELAKTCRHGRAAGPVDRACGSGFQASGARKRPFVPQIKKAHRFGLGAGALAGWAMPSKHRQADRGMATKEPGPSDGVADWKFPSAAPGHILRPQPRPARRNPKTFGCGWAEQRNLRVPLPRPESNVMILLLPMAGWLVSGCL